MRTGYRTAYRTATIAAGTPGDELRHLAYAAADGDHGALGELLRLVQPLVWRICTALGSPGEEEDLVQETYVRAMGSLRGYRGDAPVRTWLARIARNVCADHVRRRGRQTRLLHRLRLQHTDEPGHLPDGTEDLLGLLDDHRRNAFVLTQLAGLSYEEAATALGCPIGTIRSRVYRARSQLLTAIEKTEAH